MAHSKCTVEIGVAHHFFKVLNPSLAFENPCFAIYYGHTGGVVTAVFKEFQSFNYYLSCRFGPDVAYYSTHLLQFLIVNTGPVFRPC
jgi:hypothetical protein